MKFSVYYDAILIQYAYKFRCVALFKQYNNDDEEEDDESILNQSI